MSSGGMHRGAWEADQGSAQGIMVKMITGDQLAIGQETARQLGMGYHMHTSHELTQARAGCRVQHLQCLGPAGTCRHKRLHALCWLPGACHCSIAMHHCAGPAIPAAPGLQPDAASAGLEHWQFAALLPALHACSRCHARARGAGQAPRGMCSLTQLV